MGTYDPFNSSVKSIIYVVMITSHVYVAYLNFYAFVTSIFTRARTYFKLRVDVAFDTHNFFSCES